MAGPFKMKGSPMARNFGAPFKDDKKKKYKKPTSKQLKPYLEIDTQNLSDTISPSTRKEFTPAFSNTVDEMLGKEATKLLLGKHDLKAKGRLNKN